MTHEEAFNLLLANCCPKGSAGHAADNTDVYEFDLHCRTARVTAKLVNTVNTIDFEIISVEVE